MFYKYAHILGPKRSPDVMLNAFDVKFDEKKDEIPPKACRASKKLKNKNVEKVDPTKSEKQKQCRTRLDRTDFKQEPNWTGF